MSAILQHKSGYARIAGSQRRDDGVQWWYFWLEDDGWGFARGGRVRTVRDARHKLRTCTAEREHERRVFLERPQYEIWPEGLRPVERSPYELI